MESIISLEGKKYWFIRTDKGINYSPFIEGNFVAIGWNEITINDLGRFNETSESLRRKVENANQNELRDLSDVGKKSQITLIIKKNIVFHTMNKGDIVIIPSENTNFLSFGIIDDDTTYNSDSGECNYIKRRKVKWLNTQKTSRLDAKFNFITKSFHAISEIDNQYYSIINNYMFDSYFLDGFGIISLKFNTESPIHYNNLRSIIDSIIDLGNVHSKKHENQIQGIEDIELQINLQSPGFVSLKKAGIGLVFAVYLLSLGCSSNPDDKRKYDDLISEENLNKQEVDDIVQKLDSVGVILN